MAREWKPGDVAMVECSDGEWRRAFMIPALFDEHRGSWVFGDNARRWVADSNARPLAVIDPEDREQVKALRDALWKGGHLDIWQDRLREFANPTPPKPDEPTGWLAVVIDSDGDKWVRDGLPGDRSIKGDWWNHSCAARDYVGGDLRSNYADIAAVRILSPGVPDDAR